MGMNCGRLNRLMSAYLDGELSGVDMLEVRSHLRACSACEQEIESIRRVKAAMSRLQPVRASAGSEERLIALLRGEQTPAGTRLREWLSGRLFGRFQPAAVAVYACAGLLLVALGHLPQGGEWTDNYAAHHQSSAVFVPASFDSTSLQEVRTPVTVAVVSQSQGYGQSHPGDPVLSNAFSISHVSDIALGGMGGQ